MSWKRINRWLFAIVILAFAVSLIPKQDYYFGLPYENCLSGTIYLFQTLAVFVGHGILREIESYTPDSALDAKRLNEQIKLTATTINTLSIAVVTVFGIHEYAAPDPINYTRIWIFVLIALMWNIQGRNLLSKLKDESAEAYRAVAPGIPVT